MATEMGCCTMAVSSARSELAGTSVKDEILDTDGTTLHVPSAAVYGYDASEPMPLLEMMSARLRCVEKGGKKEVA